MYNNVISREKVGGFAGGFKKGAGGKAFGKAGGGFKKGLLTTLFCYRYCLKLNHWLNSTGFKAGGAFGGGGFKKGGGAKGFGAVGGFGKKVSRNQTDSNRN